MSSLSCPGHAVAQTAKYDLKSNGITIGTVKIGPVKNDIVKTQIISLMSDYSYPIGHMIYRAALVAKAHHAKRIAVIDMACVETQSRYRGTVDSRCSFSVQLLTDDQPVNSGTRGYVPVYFDVEDAVTGVRSADVIRILNQ